METKEITEYDYDSVIERLREIGDRIDHAVVHARGVAAGAQQRLQELQKELAEAVLRYHMTGEDKEQIQRLHRERQAIHEAIEDAELIESAAKRAQAKRTIAGRELQFAKQQGREPIINLPDWMEE